MQSFVFVIVAVVSAFAGIRVVTNKNLVHAALYLVVTLLGIATAFLLLTAEFVAWVQVLIYVGAVVVLLLFGLMLTRAPIGKTALDSEQRLVAGPVSVVLFAVTAPVLWRFFDGVTISLDRVSGNTEALGTQMFTKYVLPFELASVLLLAALVGAVFLAKKD